MVIISYLNMLWISQTSFFFSCVFSIQFDKPGARGDYDYPDMAKEAGAYLKRIWTLLSYSQNYRNTLWFVWSFSSIAGQKALADAGIPYSAIEQACVGYVYGNTVACKVEMLKAIILYICNVKKKKFNITMDHFFYFKILMKWKLVMFFL